MVEKGQGASSGRKCPICKGMASELFMPFCTKRCADIDLGKWFKKSYSIAGSADDDDGDRGEIAHSGNEDETL